MSGVSFIVLDSISHVQERIQNRILDEGLAEELERLEGERIKAARKLVKIDRKIAKVRNKLWTIKESK